MAWMVQIQPVFIISTNEERFLHLLMDFFKNQKMNVFMACEKKI